ncbi:hypothetical protein QNI19_28075 [Cytophagaceae bacterium DM2B3-1]|uniref:Transmembrane protein n=1 Tax=Xanthocytophaga flava TaxID=3048013 RepID=A0ABT7CSZ3_9BACT|nr:hypothetical protein [Xanthocytophaga flavus]MDJ1496825.1 hypothetical protein [Xanthocytophaga flavus]
MEETERPPRHPVAPAPEKEHLEDLQLDDQNDFYRNLLDSFAPTYLTLISIIEGVFLAMLIQKIDDNLNNIHPLQWMFIINTGIIVIIAWNEYRMGCALFKWVPATMDTLVPFALCILQGFLIWTIPKVSIIEISPNLKLDHVRIWFGSSIFIFVWGIIGYLNMFQRARNEAMFINGREEKINELTLRHLGRYPFIHYCFCVFGIIMFSTIWYICPALPENDNINLILWAQVITCIYLIAFFVKSHLYWEHIIKSALPNRKRVRIRKSK